MIKQEGTVTSFKELGETFLDFVQQSNDTTEPWEVIDDRLDSFYGATIKFPITSKKSNVNFTNMPNIDDLSKVADIVELENLSYTFIPLAPYDRLDEPITYGYNGFTYWTDASNEIPDVFKIVYGFSSYRLYQDNIVLPPSYSYDRTRGSLRSSLSSVDTTFTKLLSSSAYDFSFLANKTEVFIVTVVKTYLYYLDIEDIVFPKIVANIKAVQSKLLSKLAEINPTIDTDNFHVYPIFIYFYDNFMDIDYDRMETDNLNFALTVNANQALYNYCSYMKSIFKDEFYFVSQLDLVKSSVKLVKPSTDNFTQYSLIGSHLIENLNCFIGNGYLNGSPYKSYFLANIDKITPQDFFWFGSSIQLFSSASIDIHHNPYNTEFLSNFGISHEQYINKDKNSFTLFSDKRSSYAYISLQYNKITPTTYNEWLTNTKDNYMSESFDSRRRIPAYYNNAETWRTVTISNQYQNDVPNIFKDTGEVLFISPHIKYDKNLWMCEQGGIACDQESRTQNIEDNVIRHRKLTSNFGGYATQTFVKVPPFPSLGCPMFTINDKLLSQETINYYFIRDNNSASIVIYVPTTDSMTYSYAVQHMSFGVLDSFSISEQFMYPLYVAGGNGGLYQEHWSYYNPWGGAPNHEVGNIYKLDMENISLSNSNLLLSAKFNGANVSNFRVLCPDGHWDNIFNVTQNASLITQPACYIDAWTPRYYLLNKPQVGGSELGDSRYGGTTTLNGDDSIKRIDTGYIKPDYKATQTVQYSKTFHANAPIQPVMPVFSSHKIVSPELWPRHRYGVIGRIPRCYSTWSRHLKFGELEIGGKKFLSIPNAYDARTWYIPYSTSFQDLSTVESAYRQNANANSVLNNNYIYDYLLLKLED